MIINMNENTKSLQIFRVIAYLQIQPLVCCNCVVLLVMLYVARKAQMYFRPTTGNTCALRRLCFMLFSVENHSLHTFLQATVEEANSKTKTLTFEIRASAKRFMLKISSICININIKASHLTYPRFQTQASGNSEIALHNKVDSDWLNWGTEESYYVVQCRTISNLWV